MDGKFKVFVIVAIVVLALAIAASTFFVMTMMGKNSQGVEQTTIENQMPVLAEVALGDAIITNIASDDGDMQHYAKVQISIGIDATDTKVSDELKKVIEGKAASIRSEVISALGEQTYTMLSNTATGKEKLADEIITRLNKLLETDLVKAVYYQEYFIQ